MKYEGTLIAEFSETCGGNAIAGRGITRQGHTISATQQKTVSTFILVYFNWSSIMRLVKFLLFLVRFANYIKSNLA